MIENMTLLDHAAVGLTLSYVVYVAAGGRPAFGLLERFLK